MTRILQINSSIYSDEGVSSRLADRFVSALRERRPDTVVRRRDLAREPVPQLDAGRFAAFGTPPGERTPEQAALVAQSDQLVDELFAAEVLVIGAPMYNFSVPYQLKAWFDHVARARVTFRYTESGPEGLLQGRRAVVFSSRGGVHEGADDTETRFLRRILGLMGITDVSFVTAQGLAMGEESRSRALAEALASADRLAAVAEAA